MSKNSAATTLIACAVCLASMRTMVLADSPSWTQYNGHLAGGNDVMKARMTIDQAMKKCASLEGCQGFTYNGGPSPGKPMMMYFKSKWEIQSTGWTSWKKVARKSFIEHMGHLSDGGEIHVEKMTVDDAKVKCSNLPGCKGFTFEGESSPTEDAVDIHFKNTWDLQGTGWVSYKYDNRELVESESTKESVVGPGLQSAIKELEDSIKRDEAPSLLSEVWQFIGDDLYTMLGIFAAIVMVGGLWWYSKTHDMRNVSFPLFQDMRNVSIPGCRNVNLGSLMDKLPVSSNMVKKMDEALPVAYGALGLPMKQKMDDEDGDFHARPVPYGALPREPVVKLEDVSLDDLGL